MVADYTPFGDLYQVHISQWVFIGCEQLFHVDACDTGVLPPLYGSRVNDRMSLSVYLIETVACSICSIMSPGCLKLGGERSGIAFPVRVNPLGGRKIDDLYLIGHIVHAINGFVKTFFPDRVIPKV
jgi:hypothetical protein